VKENIFSLPEALC